jgi:hypothetical protein
VVSLIDTGPTGPTVADSGPAEDGGFLCVIKVRSTSFGGEVKPSFPCHRFTACKRAPQSMSEMLCLQNFYRTLFLTGDSPASLPDGSGC